VVYNWTRPNPLPVVLPWMAVLLLLLLRANRCAQAWWIWVPLGCVAGVVALLQSEVGPIPSEVGDFLGGAIGAAGFGLAAVWLVAGYLAWKHRVVAWVGMLLALGGVGLLTFGISQGMEGIGLDMVQGAVVLAASALVMSVAITLAGLACRGRYSPIRLCLWLMAALLLVWVLLVSPFYAVAVVFNSGNVPLLVIGTVVLSLAGSSFCLLLPFLILSFSNSFYRERLKDLLHLGHQAPPPVLEPSMPAAAAATGG
jgi:hypothetical protein